MTLSSASNPLDAVPRRDPVTLSSASNPLDAVPRRAPVTLSSASDPLDAVPRRAPVTLSSARHPLDAVVVSVEAVWRERHAFASALDAREQRALEALPFEARRKERLAGRVAAKRAAQRLLGLPLSRIAIHRAETPTTRGRPEVFVDGERLTSVFVSIAHAGGLAVARASEVAVGIDLEVVEARGSGFEALVLSPAERWELEGLEGPARDVEVTLRFALKEAIGKWLGVGLARAFHDLVPPQGAEVTTGRASQAGVELIYAAVLGTGAAEDRATVSSSTARSGAT